MLGMKLFLFEIILSNFFFFSYFSKKRILIAAWIFRQQIINYFNYTSFVLETDKKFCFVTSNNLFRFMLGESQKRKKVSRRRLFKPLKSTHCKISRFCNILSCSGDEKELFVTRERLAGFRHRLEEQQLKHSRPALDSPQWRSSPHNSTLYVTSSNLHFGLMCTLICILENFNFFFSIRLLINTLWCAMVKNVSLLLRRCRLKIKINFYFWCLLVKIKTLSLWQTLLKRFFRLFCIIRNREKLK